MLLPLLTAPWKVFKGIVTLHRRTVPYELLQAPLDMLITYIEHEVRKPNSRTERVLPNSNSDMHRQPNKHSY